MRQLVIKTQGRAAHFTPGPLVVLCLNQSMPQILMSEPFSTNVSVSIKWHSDIVWLPYYLARGACDGIVTCCMSALSTYAECRTSCAVQIRPGWAAITNFCNACTFSWWEGDKTQDKSNIFDSDCGNTSSMHSPCEYLSDFKQYGLASTANLNIQKYSLKSNRVTER